MTTLAHEMGHFLGYRKGNKFGHPDADKKHWLMTTIDWKAAGSRSPGNMSGTSIRGDPPGRMGSHL